ncbi:glycosyltransferase family 1 protein [Actimicrobium sp. CCI2.3]|uniref:glycosyltransferase family 4 protein n=1 Tax=Actimicrobium sp. CCI2.3 TaxID=3048616 RepID=UPI002AB54319|nr:glycosyltransferase family 1 protein [Actimicrobium sp. CCI2.3]MDY7573978.1 glycosyltransferase family 1 protein [Actimicrobium sp. CCI2.3]MEB0021914.1 glycosyltransferase family 1 protein [Actimicrobium sp. CCI2.3]
MSEVFIDVTRLVGRLMKGRLPTGVDRVSLAYVRHFFDHAQAVVRLGARTLVLPRQASRALFRQLLAPSPDVNRIMLWLVGREYLKFQRGHRLQGAFLFNTGHSGLEQPGYPEQLRRQGVRPLFLVHDLIPISHPEYCRAGELARHEIRMNNVLRLAQGVIANSQATLDALKDFARKTDQPTPPAVVALLAAPVFAAPSPVRPVAGPYFVIVSTIEPRKNHWLLLQLWRRLVEQMGANAPKLVVIGQRGWECENVVDLLERCELLRDVVTELPACSDADLSTYLHHAQALLFPSFAEGYGMPLVEALSHGVPVIASDLPAFREIAGDIPDYRDPLDALGWMACIEAYTRTDSAERTAQLNRIARFVPPTWSAHFQLVEGLMERLG